MQHVILLGDPFSTMLSHWVRSAKSPADARWVVLPSPPADARCFEAQSASIEHATHLVSASAETMRCASPGSGAALFRVSRGGDRTMPRSATWVLRRHEGDCSLRLGCRGRGAHRTAFPETRRRRLSATAYAMLNVSASAYGKRSSTLALFDTFLRFTYAIAKRTSRTPSSRPYGVERRLQMLSPVSPPERQERPSFLHARRSSQVEPKRDEPSDG